MTAETFNDTPTDLPERFDDAAVAIGEWAGFESPWCDDSADVIVGLAVEHVVLEANRRGATPNATAMAAVNAITAAGIVLFDASRLVS
ncbi:MAG: hypothetical protein JST73_10860 [Actinobacteria bacterium]|nr:hypothetical protein [Actinomycetota bacterium]